VTLQQLEDEDSDDDMRAPSVKEVNAGLAESVHKEAAAALEAAAAAAAAATHGGAGKQEAGGWLGRWKLFGAGTGDGALLWRRASASCAVRC
jgi:hypothetical protein